jgi:AcrR family transcriptional regulator
MEKKAEKSERRSARDRLLAAADELFYAEGIHTVGIDRVIERAGVAKASLYDCFGSKEELIRAYLTARREARQARITSYLARYTDPRERLLGMFDALREQYSQPSFRGCAFVRASAESPPGGSVRGECEISRDWMRALFADLARGAGAPDPVALARQLMMLYDGATISAQMDGDPSIAIAARAAAAALLDEASAS